jgi:mono/diheme cytochrome c family protein
MVDGMLSLRSLRRLAAVALLGSSTAACSPMDDLIVSIFGRSMREQPSLGAYSQAPLRPAPGAVSFASGNFPAALGEVNLGQAEGEPVPPPVTPLMVIMAMGNPAGVPEISGLVNPVPATAESLARGKQMYERGCVPCHGVNADGQGPVTAKGIPPWSLVAPHVGNYSDGFLYSIIRVGRGLMPGYAHQITHFDRWHVVNYLRSLQGQLPQGAVEASGDN